MAFQTGTATSLINLLDALRQFATANGWTQNMWAASGSDWRLHLQKGNVYANFLAQADDTELYIGGSLGYDGLQAWNAQPSMAPWRPFMSNAYNGAISWPVTYWFFNHASPDSIEVVIRYQITRYQWMTFGSLTKYGTYTGGEYYGAPFEGTIYLQYAFDAQNRGDVQPPVLFHNNRSFSSGSGHRNSTLHAEIDNNVWWSAQMDGGTPIAVASIHVWPLVTRSVSAFNGLMTLQPIIVYAQRPDGMWSPLGRVEHLRYCNVINHSPADIIDIGGQRWMVFPWLEKGGATDATPTTLHAGMAIKYDGP
jgi:hypothetical protein